MRRLCTFIVLAMLVPDAGADSVTTIELQSRTAEEVIPIVQPMLGANDAITGDAYTLFLRSSPETLERVRRIIETIDVPAKTLMVSVFQGSNRDLGALGISADIDIAAGDTTYNTDDSRVSVDAIATRKGLVDNPVHQVRVIEGNAAYIETGQRVPFFVDYKDVVTGFFVLPRIRGENVVLEVSPFKSTPSRAGGGSVDSQSATTTVTGPSGEWLFIGGSTERLSRTESGIVSHTSTRSREQTGIWIRADLVK